jgi:hypothetical protein
MGKMGSNLSWEFIDEGGGCMVEFTRLTPPSSSGPGRGPLKAKTGVRVPLGAHAQEDRSTDEVERFLSRW